MDIGAVDGERCDGQRSGACARLVRELATVEGPARSTELIYCWDPDGPADPRGFARAGLCDHIHWDSTGEQRASVRARAGGDIGLTGPAGLTPGAPLTM
jgi:hypothetical protein